MIFFFLISFTVACNFKYAIVRRNYSWFIKRYLEQVIRLAKNPFTPGSILAENALKEPFQKQIYLQKGNSRSILYFSAVQQYSLPTATSYTFRDMFFLFLHSVFWGYIGQTRLVSKSSIHVGDMNLDVFLPCLSLEKRLQNLYQVITLTCRERDIVNPLFCLFRNWAEHCNIQVVE